MLRTNKIWAFLAILGCLVAFHYIDRQSAISKAEKATESRLNASYQVKLNEAVKKARDVEDVLRKDSEQLKESKDAKIKQINDDLNVALSELRKRPKRPSPTDNTIHPEDTSSCTAGGLYQEDAEFLTREAARADSILLERDYYYSEYESVRRSMDAFTNRK